MCVCAYLGNDGRLGRRGSAFEESRSAPTYGEARILSVEGCARYDDYRASWTWLIPTTRRRRGRPSQSSFHGLYANFLMRRADAL